MGITHKKLFFVVHKHDATSPHYDFRLQIGDVMSSWAIPKGPTLDSSVKRLALSTTDHSLSYRTFEGVIPDGQYGAGPVMIWDEGYYLPELEIAKGKRKIVIEIDVAQQVMSDGLKNGELKFQLHGKKLHGSFALIKTHGFGSKNSWLLIKHHDEYTKPGFKAADYDYSVVSEKSIKEIHDNCKF